MLSVILDVTVGSDTERKLRDAGFVKREVWVRERPFRAVAEMPLEESEVMRLGCVGRFVTAERVWGAGPG